MARMRRTASTDAPPALWKPVDVFTKSAPAATAAWHAATISASSGLVRLPHVPTRRPSRPTRYLWKFQRGAPPPWAARKAKSGVAWAPVTRAGVVITEGLEIAGLRRFKDDVTEVREGFECGINLGSFNDLQVDDLVTTYEMREIPRT